MLVLIHLLLRDQRLDLCSPLEERLFGLVKLEANAG
jgi:hypothetical protein